MNNNSLEKRHFMKKFILGAIAIFSLANLNAQFEIRLDGDGSDISGTTIDIQVTPGQNKEVHLWVLNTGNSNEAVYITRVREEIPSGWLSGETMCWPPSCYSWGSSGNTKTTPTATAPIVTTGAYNNDTLMSTTAGGPFAEIKSGIMPDASATGSALFTYYLTGSNGTYLDSVSVRYNTVTASIKETPKINVSVSPNPASSNLTVDFEGANSANLKMVDVLGNIVLKKSISGKENVNVSNFRNGIYFVTLEAEGRKPMVRKVIVRH